MNEYDDVARRVEAGADIYYTCCIQIAKRKQCCLLSQSTDQALAPVLDRLLFSSSNIIRKDLGIFWCQSSTAQLVSQLVHASVRCPGKSPSTLSTYPCLVADPQTSYPYLRQAIPNPVIFRQPIRSPLVPFFIPSRHPALFAALAACKAR